MESARLVYHSHNYLSGRRSLTSRHRQIRVQIAIIIPGDQLRYHSKIIRSRKEYTFIKKPLVCFFTARPEDYGTIPSMKASRTARVAIFPYLEAAHKSIVIIPRCRHQRQIQCNSRCLMLKNMPVHDYSANSPLMK